jgi:tRNA nucleotidyltransferase/poly(A) polymerase
MVGIENGVTSHFLSDVQIKFLKHVVMKNMIQATLSENPSAYLFGGAVRDMVLEHHQFGQESHEYDPEKSVVSHDLDFFVTTQGDFQKLQKFFLDQYHIQPVESKYPGTNFSVFSVRKIPLITG